MTANDVIAKTTALKRVEAAYRRLAKTAAAADALHNGAGRGCKLPPPFALYGPNLVNVAVYPRSQVLHVAYFGSDPAKTAQALVTGRPYAPVVLAAEALAAEVEAALETYRRDCAKAAADDDSALGLDPPAPAKPAPAKTTTPRARRGAVPCPLYVVAPPGRATLENWLGYAIRLNLTEAQHLRDLRNAKGANDVVVEVLVYPFVIDDLPNTDEED